MTAQEVREMLDSTITANGKREISGQALNAALHAIVDHIELSSRPTEPTPSTNPLAEAFLLFDNVLDSETLISDFEKHGLANQLNKPLQCLIKDSASAEHYKYATLIVEKFGDNYRLTFTFPAAAQVVYADGAMSEEDRETLYVNRAEFEPDATLKTSPRCLSFSIQPNGYVIPLGEGFARPEIYVIPFDCSEFIQINIGDSLDGVQPPGALNLEQIQELQDAVRRRIPIYLPFTNRGLGREYLTQAIVSDDQNRGDIYLTFLTARPFTMHINTNERWWAVYKLNWNLPI